MDDHLSLAAISKRWNVSRVTLRRWIAAGQLRAVRLPSGVFRMPREEVIRIERQPVRERAA